MADTIHPDSRGSWRDPWRWLAGGGLLLALGGLLLANKQKLFSVRADDTTAQPVRSVDPPQNDERPKVAFEPTDWRLAPVAFVYVGTILLLIVSCFVLIVAYPHALPDVGRSVRIEPPGPRLQTDPEGDLQQFRTEEEKRLNSFYWIDKQKGVVHIPIEQAMKKLATSGFDGFPKGQP